MNIYIKSKAWLEVFVVKLTPLFKNNGTISLKNKENIAVKLSFMECMLTDRPYLSKVCVKYVSIYFCYIYIQSIKMAVSNPWLKETVWSHVWTSLVN